jgi:hypothetical protein
MDLDSKSIQLSFSYFELKLTGETHIFQGEFTAESGCTIGDTSLCGEYSKKMHKINIIKLCLKREQAQKMVKSFDKCLCSLCVDRLYQK